MRVRKTDRKQPTRRITADATRFTGAELQVLVLWGTRLHLQRGLTDREMKLLRRLRRAAHAGYKKAMAPVPPEHPRGPALPEAL